MSSSDEEPIEIELATIQELDRISTALNDVDTEITAKQFLMSKDILTHRQSTISKIPSFWAVVLQNASSELDAPITSADAEIFADALVGMEVSRPEIPASAKATDSGLAKFGEPRSLTIKFAFSDNKWFTDKVLTKTLWYRYGKDGSAGLVSDPVKINWKSGKDITDGLTDAAYNFWAAQKKNASQKLEAVLDNEARSARDEAAKKMPEYKTLAKLNDSKATRLGDAAESADKIKSRDLGLISFFNFFSYRGRWVSAAESVVAKKEFEEKLKKSAAGEADDSDDEDEDDDDEFGEEDVETFPAGHEVAVAIAEDIWPSAIDYFMLERFDTDDELDGMDDEDSDDDDEDDEDVDMS